MTLRDELVKNRFEDIQISDSPDVFVGGTGDDLLNGDRGGNPFKKTFTFGFFPFEQKVTVELPNSANDFIFGFGGSDTIRGDVSGPDLPGNDIIFGDGVVVNEFGIDGDDFIDAQGGDDIAFGGGADDTIFGGNGNDFLIGDYLLGFEFTIPPITIVEDVVEIGSIEVGGTGNEGNDFISGGAGDDLAIGDRGDDTINGDEGNDSLIGSADDDIINGGDGDDLIIGDYLVPEGFSIPLPEGGSIVLDLGPTGNDTLSGGAGNDVISGDDGIDTVTYAQDPGGVTVTLGLLFVPGVGTAQDGFGGSDLLFGIENIIGSSFNDTLTGDSVGNVITAGAGDDKVSAGGGNDTVTGGAGNDFLDGHDGNDVLNSGEGDDTALGGGGDDTLIGGAGNDFLDGHGGDDVLNGGKGADILVGGLFGSDTASYSTSDIGVEVSLTTGTGSSGDARGDWLIDIENLEGSAFGDILTGNFVNNKIFGLGGDDKISGEAGDDTLNGQLGDDFLFGGLGNDELFGEQGRDVLFGEAGNDQLFGGDDLDELDGGAGDDRLFGEAGNDRLFGQEGDDQLFGGTGNDTIDGGTGVDILWGDGGNDTLLGKDGNDELKGGDGNDELDGGKGDDILDGGSGLNTLKGGKGHDLFILTDFGGGIIPNDVNTILDFEVGKDLFGLKGGLSFGQLGISQQANNTIISVSRQTIPFLPPIAVPIAILSDVEANTLTAQNFVAV